MSCSKPESTCQVPKTKKIVKFGSTKKINNVTRTQPGNKNIKYTKEGRRIRCGITTVREERHVSDCCKCYPPQDQ